MRAMGGVFIISLMAMLLVGVFRENVYDPKLGINILLVTDEGMGIVGVRGEENLANYLVLPNNLMIQTRRGEFQVEGLWKVGLPGREGLSDIRVGVGRTLGVVLGGAVKTNSGVGVAELMRAMTSLSSSTNLSFIDRLRLYADLNNLLKKGLRLELTLPQNGLDSFVEPDGKSVFRPNGAIFLWIKNQWANEQLLAESAEISVINASGKDGLGRTVSRQLETAGVRVVDLDSSSKVLAGRCLLLGNKLAGTKILRFLRETFGCRLTEKGNSDYVDREVKSDLIMVLGEGDY